MEHTWFFLSPTVLSFVCGVCLLSIPQQKLSTHSQLHMAYRYLQGLVVGKLMQGNVEAPQRRTDMHLDPVFLLNVPEDVLELSFHWFRLVMEKSANKNFTSKIKTQVKNFKKSWTCSEAKYKSFRNVNPKTSRSSLP